MERRDFLKTSAMGAAAISVPPEIGRATPFGPPPETFDAGDMKYRILGRTGARVSIVGLGGFHLAKPGGPSAEEAVRIVHAAVDGGINFCDNCWDYNGGESEIRLGRALRGGWRERVFLMTKIDGRTAASATAQLETSLRRLQTDHLDLLQFHEIIRMNDPDLVFAPSSSSGGGALETVLRARQQGKLRFIGFTGHKSPAIHRMMFEVAAAHDFHFDTVQMPVNIMDAHFDSFQKVIFPIAQQRQTAVLAMKTFGDPFILQAQIASPTEMLHYSMSQPVAVVITGIDRPAILHQALQAARSWRPMTAEQQWALLARSAQAAAAGDTERYKTSTHFDGTVQHPEYLTQLG